MSYALDYPIAESAPADARALFIRRTYAHLAGAVLAFIGVEYLLLNLPGIPQLALSMLTGFNWLIVLAVFMGAGWLAQMWAQSSSSPALQYAGLGLYVLVEAIIFVPLLYIAENFAPGAIQSAAVMTLAVFGGLTVTVLKTKHDFSYLGPILSIGGFLALGLIVAAVLFQFSLGLIFSFAMVALISGYIIYYTSNILHHYRTDQHVAAALALFASVATLFWYILQISMMSRD